MTELSGVLQLERHGTTSPGLREHKNLKNPVAPHTIPFPPVSGAHERIALTKNRTFLSLSQPPAGMQAAPTAKSASGLVLDALPVPSGGSPDGTGGSPVLPGFESSARRLDQSFQDGGEAFEAPLERGAGDGLFLFDPVGKQDTPARGVQPIFAGLSRPRSPPDGSRRTAPERRRP